MLARDEAAPSMMGETAEWDGGITVPSIPPSPSTDTAQASDRKVIHNASLDLMVKNAEETMGAVEALVEEQKGFVDNATIYEVQEGVKAGRAIIRVPADAFTATIAALKQLAVKVLQENSDAQDVTMEFTDLEAQLKNFRAEEVQYQTIMNRATKIEDVLSVASRLADVRGRIEQTQGRMNYLSRQVEMSAITITLTPEPQVKVTGIIWRPWAVIKQETKNLLTNLAGFADFLIAFVFGLPLFLLRVGFFFLILFVLWKIGRFGARVFFGWKGPPREI